MHGRCAKAPQHGKSESLAPGGRAGSSRQTGQAAGEAGGVASPKREESGDRRAGEAGEEGTGMGVSPFIVRYAAHNTRHSKRWLDKCKCECAGSVVSKCDFFCLAPF